MDLSIGTSGFAYKEWNGTFYPEGLSSSGMLRYYAEHFRAVEINSTFFRMPTESVLREWADDVPDGFRFALKAPQLITHRKRLNEVAEPVTQLFRVAAALEARLGPVLFQLPPNFKKNLTRLETFLELVPKDARVAIEFRHPSWFEEDVLDALRGRAAALCVAHGEDVDTPPVATADWGYLRLRQVTYTEAELQEWQSFVRGQGWSEVHVFFKHEDTGTGPTLARQFEEMFGRSPG
ncbi:MAG: DUF72 domain-containing protein [Gemmatimonadetes bacterium]|nr:DUF72 domain-containing protein [Gemmatimonadota bacterium]